MLTALRRRVQAVLEQADARRKPALRRWDAPGALLGTDLPAAADEMQVQIFISRMETQGWRVQREGIWLLLDCDVPVPQACPPEKLRGEWGCCVALLARHGGTEAPAESIRALAKAAEEGNDKVERLCRLWHGEFAACLREHRPLPGGLLPYLCAAMKEDMP